MIVWPMWAILAGGSFGVLEYYGIEHPPPPGQNSKWGSLSHYMWWLGKWRMTLVVWGIIIGGLSVHFWWNWCPDLGSVNGGLEYFKLSLLTQV